MAEFGNSYFYLFGWSSEICERFLLRFNLNVNVNNLHPQNAEVYRDIIKPTNSFSRLVLAVLINIINIKLTAHERISSIS